MKRYLLYCFFFVMVFSIAFPSYVFAQDTMISGENQYYSVFLRGNGEAVVSVKIQLTNRDSAPISTLQYFFPSSLHPHNVMAYQAFTFDSQKPCLYSPEPSSSLRIVPPGDLPCDFTQYNNTYLKSNYKIQGNTLTVSLPNTIYDNQTGNIILFFRADGYVRKSLFGALAYEFETLQSEKAINALQVGISTEQEYILKDAKGSVSYQYTGESITIPPASKAEMIHDNASFDSYYGRIGQGTVYKYTSNLAPRESYTVKGMYANSTIKLYSTEIFIGLAVFLLCIFIVVVTLLRLQRFMKIKTGKNQPLAISFAISFLSAALVMGYTCALSFAASYVGSQIFPYDSRGVLFLLAIFTAIGVYIFLLVIPAVLFAMKKGWWWGIILFSEIVAWLVVFGFVSVLVAVILHQRPYDGYTKLPPLQSDGRETNVRQLSPEKPL